MKGATTASTLKMLLFPSTSTITTHKRVKPELSRGLLPKHNALDDCARRTDHERSWDRQRPIMEGPAECCLASERGWLFGRQPAIRKIFRKAHSGIQSAVALAHFLDALCKSYGRPSLKIKVHKPWQLTNRQSIQPVPEGNTHSSIGNIIYKSASVRLVQSMQDRHRSGPGHLQKTLMGHP